MANDVCHTRATRIAKLLAEEIVPLFGVPEALLSDHGTNLLLCLIQDVYKLLGIKKLNTTAHHPQCNGMVERFNSTLKTMLRMNVYNLRCNGTHTYPVYYGHTATRNTLQQVKNHHFYCLDSTAITLLMQLCCQQGCSMLLR